MPLKILGTTILWQKVIRSFEIRWIWRTHRIWILRERLKKKPRRSWGINLALCKLVFNTLNNGSEKCRGRKWKCRQTYQMRLKPWFGRRLNRHEILGGDILREKRPIKA